MISSQRLIMISVLLSLTLVMATDIYRNIGNTDYYTTLSGEIINFTSQHETRLSEAQSNDSIYGTIKTENPVQENQVGNSVTWGGRVLKTIFFAFVPWPIHNDAAWEPLERWTMTLINLFRTILIFFIYLEVFLIWFNKKTS